jgi:phospholipase A1
VTRPIRLPGTAALRLPCLLVLLALTCMSARAEYILLPPPDALVAGGPVTLVLMITNDRSEAIEVDIPLKLDLRLTTDGEAFNTSLAADPPPVPATVQLAPQSFRKIRYSGKLPDTLEGVATLRARDVEANSLVIAVQRAPHRAAEGVIQDKPPAPGDGTHSSRFLSALSTYDPMYFAVGTRVTPSAKFQLSFKYRFFVEDGPLAQRASFLGDLYFGYTQTSLWDLRTNSAPFYDSSYKPRLFYLNPDLWEWPGKKVRLGLEGGVGHESNGKSGGDSRGLNIAYVKPILRLGDPQGWHWTIQPMLVDYLETSDNPDIADYRGYVNLQVIFGKADGLQISGQFQNGSRGFATQFDLSYPLPAVTLGNLDGYLLLQYFGGYGESIVDYNRRLPSQVRLGLMVVRW